jgi:nitrate/nitrite transporter NarK
MAGAISGMFSAQLIGRVLHYTNNNYLAPFAVASAVYLAAVAVIHILAPRLERADIRGLS